MTEEPDVALNIDIAALCEALEEKRAGIFRKALGVMGAAAACAFAAVWFLAGSGGLRPGDSSLPAPLFLGALAALAAAIIALQIVNFLLYKPQMREAFMGVLAQRLGLAYNPKGVFSLGSVRDHAILPPADEEHTEDGFEGEVNGAKLAFQEARLVEVIRTRKRRGDHYEDEVTRHTLFEGLIVRIGIRRTLERHTVVIPNSAIQSFFRTAFSSFDKVNMAAPPFEKRYDVLSTDQVEARYVLDPAFMERFMEAEDLIRPRSMRASFKGREIVFAFHLGREAFRLPFLLLPVREKRVRETADLLVSVLRLIEVLKLNPYTGL